MRDHLDAGQGLRLRPWAERDAEAVLTAFADPLMRGQAAAPVDSPEAAALWVTGQIQRWEAQAAFAFAVVSGAGEDVLGNVAVGAVDRRHATGWVSYWTTPAARGRGVAARACRALSRFAFDEVGLFRLELGHRVNNPASCRVATAAGYLVEGLERQKLAYDGVRYDVELHARLATDPEPAG
ncbi:GNAT family N-acetyltransferase [Streptacidiphilus jiangxiensis]|uniref:Protein N-acetyltransferase, RimJ/RimL family n=1 Tax=Streptacidiphilus jiangxiensis TaxID=235985 RepID=A0A1H7XB15_STRJI|nr:GNAT family protein [Streptacidiphilus jiangxiensis]SEM30845.1 Protein N-acetyltransferase, RimJ/RimL family [Streptacidiphilus jiangxiensis]